MSDRLTSGSVQHAIPASSIQSSIPKSTITKRNAKPKKGLGAKKVGGLGGKKVAKADFEKLEKSAEENDQFKQRLSVSSTISDRSNLSKDTDPSGESLRLAYQDITLKEKQNNAKLSKMDERKKEQATRLGMGMGKTEGVSHSVDMITIDQVNPAKQSRRGKYRHDDDTFYDAFPSSKNSRSHRYKWDVSDSDEEEDESESMDRIDFSYSGSKKSSSSVDAPPSYTVTPIGDGHRAETNIFMSATTAEPKNDRQRSKKSAPEPKKNDGLDKFQNANAISSDMLFGTDSMQETHRERVRKFEGQSSISSDDYFDRDSASSRSARGGNTAGIRDGVKEGVRSVAGRLSNMATDIASTLQDRYG